MNKVTDEEMKKALENNEYQKIMNKASKQYSKYMNADELKTCQMNALWNSMRNFQPKSKFTTYLYNYVRYECLNHLSFIKQESFTNWNIENKTFDKKDEFYDCINCIKDEKIKKIIEKRFVEQKTLKEMEADFGISHEAIRQKIKKGLEIIKEYLINL